MHRFVNFFTRHGWEAAANLSSISSAVFSLGTRVIDVRKRKREENDKKTRRMEKEETRKIKIEEKRAKKRLKSEALKHKREFKAKKAADKEKRMDAKIRTCSRAMVLSMAADVKEHSGKTELVALFNHHWHAKKEFILDKHSADELFWPAVNHLTEVYFVLVHSRPPTHEDPLVNDIHRRLVEHMA